jgi:hypothetical protein
MLTMTPLAIFAENEYQPNAHRYRVRFLQNEKEVDFTFTVTEREFPGVRPDDEEFSTITLEDPLMPKLMQTILDFLEARK